MLLIFIFYVINMMIHYFVSSISENFIYPMVAVVMVFLLSIIIAVATTVFLKRRKHAIESEMVFNYLIYFPYSSKI